MTLSPTRRAQNRPVFPSAGVQQPVLRRTFVFGGADRLETHAAGNKARAAALGNVARTTSVDPTTARLLALCDATAPQVIAWRHEFHAHPELSNREVLTGKRIAELLRDIGVDAITTSVAHNGVVAIIHGSKPGPTVGFRAEMDGLPIKEEPRVSFPSQNDGIMHSCGHDSHMAMLLGAAKVLVQARDSIQGTVKLIFQPSEEGPPPGEEGGASLMVKEGVLDNPKVDAMFTMHASSEIPVGVLGYLPGEALASADRFRVTVKGLGSHGAKPWLGVDPIDIFTEISSGIKSIVARENDPRNPMVITIGDVRANGRFNVIPDTLTFEGSIRALDKDSRVHAIEAFKRICTMTAEAHRGKVEINIDALAPMVFNDAKLVSAMVPSLETAAGTGNVRIVKPLTGSDDFAFFADKVPSFFYWMGVRNDAIGANESNHTPRWLMDENALPLGLKSLVMLAVNYASSVTRAQRTPRTARP